MWDINKTKTLLGDEVWQVLPFVYTLTCCDTVSRLFSVGKASALKKAQNDSHFFKQAKVFMEKD